MQIEYIGEHLFWGYLGNFFIALAFVAALVSTISYYITAKSEIPDPSWKRFARISFSVHSFAVVGIIATLFYMILAHYFEYHYVWEHSNTIMPRRYTLACFWEGQEGSFLLWTFWHVVLGNILMRTAKDWEAPVLTVVSAVQVFLSSMLLGVYISGYKLGSNPFLLLREHPEMANLPFIQIPDYLRKLDGRGLNPLLQNYWMTIHPPTLFLGFASTVVPFAYAIAGLWKKKYSEWVKPALPWTFFGVMVLGTGILMGGAWAYEALSFGGFWAWDPVENASLVPWLTFVGAAHVMIIHKNKGQSLLITFILTIITFLLILYSTFLTRSGILGDTSVHAFTDLGMSGQLLLYLFFFLILSIVLLVINWKHLRDNKEDESIMSREFWMFIGALVLAVSCFQIIFTTSIPVINKIFSSNIAPPLNPIKHYNSWQIPIAIVVALLIAIGQYFKFKKTEPKQIINGLSIPLLISLVLTVIVCWLLKLYEVFYIGLLFASFFAIVANLNYFVTTLKGKSKLSGASIAHVGFGMILLGALISTSKSEIISQNSSGVDLEKLGKDFKNNDNIMLVKNDTLRMGDYFVTYKGKRKEGVNVFYEIEYITKDKTGKATSQFTLYPVVQTNPRMGNVAEPATKHYLTSDVYTHITYAELEDTKSANPDEYKPAKTFTVAPGDSIYASNCIVIFEGFDKNVEKGKFGLDEKDIAVGALIKAMDMKNHVYSAEPVYAIKDVYVHPIGAGIEELGMKFNIVKLIPEKGKMELSIAEKNGNSKEFIIMKAIVFPYINVLWSGCLLLIFGSVVAIRKRIKQLNG